MRMSVDFEQSIPDVQYEKSKGSLSLTQTDMERKAGNNYDQINVISLEDKSLQLILWKIRWSIYQLKSLG